MPGSWGDTILSTESMGAAVASLSPPLTPASPVLVPVRDFEIQIKFPCSGFDVGGRTAWPGGGR